MPSVLAPPRASSAPRAVTSSWTVLIAEHDDMRELPAASLEKPFSMGQRIELVLHTTNDVTAVS